MELRHLDSLEFESLLLPICDDKNKVDAMLVPAELGQLSKPKVSAQLLAGIETPETRAVVAMTGCGFK